MNEIDLFHYIEVMVAFLRSLTVFDLLEYIASIASLIGAYLISGNTGRGGFRGHVFYVLANVCWISFAIHNHHWGMLFTQVGFQVTAFRGLILFYPARHSLSSPQGQVHTCPSGTGADCPFTMQGVSRESDNGSSDRECGRILAVRTSPTNIAS